MQVAALNVLTVRMGRMVVRIILMIVVSEKIMPQKKRRKKMKMRILMVIMHIQRRKE